MLRSVVGRGRRLKPATLKTITIGYNSVPDLISDKVAAATAFWNDEGVQLSHRKPAFQVFRVENFGAPSYPELVVCTTAALLNRQPNLARGLVHTLVDVATQYVLQHPLEGEHDLESQVSGLSAQAVNQQLAAELPSFLPKGAGAYGSLDRSVLNAWASWEAKFGIVKKMPERSRRCSTDRSFLPRCEAAASLLERPYWARSLRNSSRTDSVRPHICRVSTRPGARLANCAQPPPVMPVRRRAASCPAVCTAGTEAAWPKRWATSRRQCHSRLEYGCALQVTSSVEAST